MGSKMFVLHRPLGHFFEVSDLLVTQTAEMAQQNELSILRTELVDGAPEPGGEFTVFQMTERVFVVVLHPDLDLVPVTIGAIQGDGLQAPSPEMIDPVRRPILAVSMRGLPSKARLSMNKAMVKPMPPSQATP